MMLKMGRIKAFVLVTGLAGLVSLIGVALAQGQGFIKVEGASLENRLQEAIRQGRAGGGRFWVGYSFPLRPGVIISRVQGVEGPVIEQYPGSRSRGGAGTPPSTRAALFLLYDAGEGDGAAPLRAELSDMERRRVNASGGEKVYWVGDVGSEESFALLRRLVESGPDVRAERRRDDVAARLTDAVALHEEEGGRVNSLLEELARGAAATGARLRAVAWLGRTSGEESFVLEVARDRSQPADVRRLAVRTLLKKGAGEADEGGATANSISLRQLYEAVADRELKAEIIDASPKRRNKEEVVQFLQEVGRSDPDAELRERALWRLNSKKVTGEKGRRRQG